jgi:ABC-2 type transport system ATP-binding protein
MAETAITVANISKSFGKFKALENVSFQVPAGSIFGLLGPNGAGKTTLFSVVANFLRADAGSVGVLGIDARKTSLLQGRLAILPQDALFQRNLPIVDQLVFFRRLAGRTKAQAQEDARIALGMVGLGHCARRNVRALSHGMTKRLGIAQAFLGHPEVILLDEPTAGLDPKNARQIRDLIREFQARSSTVVVSSHNLLEIQDICDHVAILDHGKLIASGPVSEIARSGRELDLRLSRDPDDKELAELAPLTGLGGLRRLGPGRWAASLEFAEDQGTTQEEADKAIAALLKGLLDKGIVPRELREGSTLEDRFLKLTGGGSGGGGNAEKPSKTEEARGKEAPGDEEAMESALRRRLHG